MFYPSKMLFSLLALLPSMALARRDYSVTKTFKFKEDFFIKFHPLPIAIGPNESEEVLLAALNDIRREFKNTWIDQIESNLQGGDCTVNRGKMRLPEFSLCDWKYPDRYDVDELPTPGQCYDYEDGFIQRIYYEIKKLEITCPEDFSYDDLDKDAYTEAVFSGQNFLNIINPPYSSCDGDESTTCLFSGAETAEWSTLSECTAELYINRFVDIPVCLKCLSTYGYGRSIANKLITALDKYFEEVITVLLTEEILEQAPEGSIYNFASPYDSDREYCAHGDYYGGGNLVDQVPNDYGILITRFTYGFDVIWYKPKDFKDDLLPNVEDIIKSAFGEGDFLRFLKEEYPNYDFIQDDDVCDVIDPGECYMTFPPTGPPTTQPTMGPSLSPSLSPTIAPSIGPTLPETLIPTESPVEYYPHYPPTPSPTCPRCTYHPGDTEEDDCPIVTIGTCGDGDRGDGICPYAGYCCSKWGYCGCTSEYCDDDSIAPTPSKVPGAPPAPSYSVDAGQCASGRIGDGFCPGKSLCCSDWGYCGSGETYCYNSGGGNGEGIDGTCGGGGVGDGACSSGLCCSRFGFCGEGELYCTGQNGGCVDDAAVDEAEQIIYRSPLPLYLKPEMGFRCGVTEVDARSNCKSECTHHVQCSNGDECWGVQLNYCNAFEESGAVHPICTDLDLANTDSRCGYDEASARGYCGPKCDSDDDCAVPGEFCFPTLLNLCDCHGERCPEAYETYSFAKELISPYFVEREPNVAEGKPRNASFKLNLSVAASLLVVFASMNALVAML